MTTNTPSEQALLAEYQACHQAINSGSSSYWTLAGIFIGFTSAILGGLIYGVISNQTLTQILLKHIHSTDNREFLMLGIIAWVLSMAILIILYFLKGWLNRYNFLSSLYYKRIREIEIDLGMRKSFIAPAIDDWNILKPELDKLRKLAKEKEKSMRDGS